MPKRVSADRRSLCDTLSSEVGDARSSAVSRCIAIGSSDSHAIDKACGKWAQAPVSSVGSRQKPEPERKASQTHTTEPREMLETWRDLMAVTVLARVSLDYVPC